MSCQRNQFVNVYFLITIIILKKLRRLKKGKMVSIVTTTFGCVTLHMTWIILITVKSFDQENKSISKCIGINSFRKLKQLYAELNMKIYLLCTFLVFIRTLKFKGMCLFIVVVQCIIICWDNTVFICIWDCNLYSNGFRSRCTPGPIIELFFALIRLLINLNALRFMWIYLYLSYFVFNIPFILLL